MGEQTCTTAATSPKRLRSRMGPFRDSKKQAFCIIWSVSYDGVPFLLSS